jgi:hypothetical protein
MESKSFRTKFVLIVGGAFFIEWLLSVIFMVWSDDEIAIKTFDTINENTPYIMEIENNITKGVLGDFYHCIVNYRSIYQMTTKKGISERTRLIVSDSTYFDMGFIDNEVYRFSIYYINGGIEQLKTKRFVKLNSSDSYAVNCNLNLLKKIKNK